MTLQAGDERALQRDRARLLYRHLPFTLIGNVVSASGVCAVLWQFAPHGRLLGWLSAILAITALRYRIRLRFARTAEPDPAFWMRRYTLYSGLSGCIWGSAGVLLFVDDPVVVVTLVIVFAGMVAGSVMSHSSYLPAYTAYAIPTILPFVLVCLAQGTSFYTTLGILSLMYLTVNVYYGRNIQAMLLDSLRLRFENLRLVEELRAQKEVAEMANMAKTRFLAAASHDLRQPVQAIELFTDALEHDLARSPSQSLVRHIRSAGRGLGDLLNALLDFSDIESETTRPAVIDFPAEDLFEWLENEFEPLAAAEGLTFRSRPYACWLRSDPLLLKRILRNLLTNAIKYNTPGGKILLAARPEGASVRIEVRDSGIGIPPSRHADVFREFYQLDNPERDRRKGLGLGLAIADGLAGLLAHPLCLRSSPGQGSTFSVTVPRGSPVPKHGPVDAPPEHFEDVSVVVIDDDAAIRAAASELFERWGCAVVAAESAEEVLELMEASGFRPDLLLVDYRLRKGASGTAAIDTLRRRLGEVPAAIITGDTDPQRLIEARASGYPLLHKPLSGTKLRMLMANLLQVRS